MIQCIIQQLLVAVNDGLLADCTLDLSREEMPFETIDKYKKNIPVSYTHLDVYKRQGRFRSLFIAGTVSSSQTIFSTFLYKNLIADR